MDRADTIKMRMANRVGLVSAAGSGIGRAGALRLAAEGATVAIADIDSGKLESTAAAIREIGGKPIALVGDLGEDAFAAEIVRRATEEFGSLDFLWNHVGIPGPAAIENLDMEEYDRAFRLNLRSGLVSTRAALPYLASSGRGSVLFTASSSAVVGSPLSPVYSATKFAQVGLMKSMAKRYGPQNIRFNCVAPGSVDTPMLRQFFARADDTQPSGEVEQKIVERSGAYPLRRIATPTDIANAALFLLSDEAAFITGAVLLVDGGLTA